MLDLIIVLVALGLLSYFAFKGITLIILAPVAALFAAAVTGDLPILGAYTQIFMGNTGSFIVSFFPLFLLGAIFGKLMDDTGAAKAVAEAVSARLGPERAILSVVLCCGALTYGGVSAFVVAFAIFPVAAALFRTADIPKRLIPGALALGAFTPPSPTARSLRSAARRSPASITSTATAPTRPTAAWRSCRRCLIWPSRLSLSGSGATICGDRWAGT